MTHQDDSEQAVPAGDVRAYEPPIVEELATDDGPAATAAGTSGPAED